MSLQIYRPALNQFSQLKLESTYILERDLLFKCVLWMLFSRYLFLILKL